MYIKAVDAVLVAFLSERFNSLVLLFQFYMKKSLFLDA